MNSVVDVTDPGQYSLSTFEKRTSHVDWWLYKDASPYDEFEMIDNFEEYLQTYIKERDEKK